MILDLILDLEVTGRSRPDFACSTSHILAICMPKIIEIAAVVPKKITHLTTLGCRVRNDQISSFPFHKLT